MFQTFPKYALLVTSSWQRQLVNSRQQPGCEVKQREFYKLSCWVFSEECGVCGGAGIAQPL